MATWDDVERIAAALPEVERRGSHDGNPAWYVRGKMFVWDRPLRPADLAHLGPAAPTGPLVGVRVADEGAKRALCASQPDVCFTTPHFDGYAAVLVQLDRIPVDELEELVEESWLLRAPKRVAAAYLEARGSG
jgi:hypothetical protein